MLKVENSCEIVDLIHEIVAKTGKSYSEVEEAMFFALYDENTLTTNKKAIEEMIRFLSVGNSEEYFAIIRASMPMSMVRDNGQRME